MNGRRNIFLNLHHAIRNQMNMNWTGTAFWTVVRIEILERLLNWRLGTKKPRYSIQLLLDEWNFQKCQLHRF